jgi:VIT1/CCC1 family predicted Fe2+/Mn2+ transporter
MEKMEAKQTVKPKVERAWLQNWQREIEGVFLYSKLAELADSPELKRALQQMAEQEKSHAAIWGEYIHNADERTREPRIDLRIRMVLWLAHLLGVHAVLGLLISDEVSDISSYSDQAHSMGHAETYSKVLSDETAHARALATLRGDAASKKEPWHRGVTAGGLLRNMVYGFNDGLTANFGLVMGVVGAAVESRVILLTGFAGLLADALSMAASGFLAARSEEEVRQHHLALEETELRLMPKEEREELIGFYTQKGLTRQEAVTVADRLMQNPDAALTQLAREELGIDPEAPGSPLREGIVTGIATGLGAVIPIVPFIFWQDVTAIWAGVVISMLAHFLVGAGRSVFTGRPALRSGLDMFVVGMGVAIVTYLLGLLIGGRL